MRRSLLGLVAAMLLAVTLVPSNSLAAEAEVACGPDFLFIGARGSDEAPSPQDQSESDYANNDKKGMGAAVFAGYAPIAEIVSDHDRTIDYHALRYPAVGVDVISAGGKMTSLGHEYDDSVAIGAADLRDIVRQTHADCPSTRFILSAYSQGVDAIATGLVLLTAAERALVVDSVFFGDPQFNADDVASDRGAFQRDHNGFYAPRAFWSTLLSSPVASFCKQGDIICGSTVYQQTPNVAGYVGIWVRDFLGIQGWAHDHNEGPMAEHDSWKSSKNTVGVQPMADALGMGYGPSGTPLDIAIVIDSSDSADQRFADLQLHAAEVAEAAAAKTSNFRIAVVDFKGRDVSGMASLNNPYTARTDVPFTNNTSAVASGIENIVVGGGSLFDAWSLYTSKLASGYTGLRQALQLPWRPGAVKQIVVFSGSKITHNWDNWGSDRVEDFSGITWNQMQQEIKSIDDLQIDAVVATDDWAVGDWQYDVSGITGGSQVHNFAELTAAETVAAKTVARFNASR